MSDWQFRNTTKSFFRFELKALTGAPMTPLSSRLRALVILCQKCLLRLHCEPQALGSLVIGALRLLLPMARVLTEVDLPN